MIRWFDITKGYCVGYVNDKIEYIIFTTIGITSASKSTMQLFIGNHDSMKSIERYDFVAVDFDTTLCKLQNFALENLISHRKLKIDNIIKGIK
jgi:hypothetical protein